MARETIKSLKEEIEKLKLQMNTLSEQNSRLIKQADQEFLNSYVYRELSEKVQFLQNYSKTLENENQRLKDKLEEKKSGNRAFKGLYDHRFQHGTGAVINN